MISSMLDSVRAAKFLFVAPLVLALQVVINLMTSPGHWWVQWAACCGPAGVFGVVTTCSLNDLSYGFGGDKERL